MRGIIDITRLTVLAGEKKILDDVSLSIPSGKIFGIVGGSGSGKTTLGMSLMRLLPKAMRVMAGNILFEGDDVVVMDDVRLRKLRGRQIGMVFQEPLSAFDPLFTIGYQLDEALASHTTLPAKQRLVKIISVLQSVEIDDVERVRKSYPHQLSGGLRQRAMIAQAIICDPQLIIADESTSSLDVTNQAKIIALYKRLNQEQGMTIVFISHDLGLVGFAAHHMAVVHQGRVVESGETQQVMRAPKDAYTRELLKAF